MDLPSFITKLGVNEAAEFFGETTRTIRAWKHRERYPKPRKALEIEERTKGHPIGRVRVSEIYAERT